MEKYLNVQLTAFSVYASNLCVLEEFRSRVKFLQTNFQLNCSYQLWPINNDNNGKYSYDNKTHGLASYFSP